MDMTDSSMCLLYVTFANQHDAKAMAKLLLNHKLIACANIMESLSCYEWDGQFQENKEAIALFKTTPAMADSATDMIAQHHSYDCPCILTLPTIGGHLPFMQWAQEQINPTQRD